MNAVEEAEVVGVRSKICRKKAQTTGATPVIVSVKIVEEKEAEKENISARKESRKKNIINVKKRNRTIVLHQRMMKPIQMFDEALFLGKKLECI